MAVKNKYNTQTGKRETELDILKRHAQDSMSYFRLNNERYINYMKFICETAITDDVRQKLVTMSKPSVEFNETEAFINRQVGEFMMQSPSFDAHPSSAMGVDTMSKELLQTCQVVEDYTRYLVSPEKTDNIYYHTMQEMMRGGFSVWNIATDYENEMSFDQCINIKREQYPTSCFFDPMAMESHKGDGEYCGRIIPYKKEDAEREFGKEISTGGSYSRSFGNFNWSYRDASQKIVLLCEQFVKEKKQVSIVKLANGFVMEKKEYRKMLSLWDDLGYLEQPPIVINERITTINEIKRYLFSEKEVIEEEATDYRYLPLVFFDLNSVFLQDIDGGSKRQMTRPYVYHLKGIQEVKNMVGQQLAYEIESTVAHKLMMPVESVDDNYLEALRNYQIPDVVLYRAYREGDTENPVPPPQWIQRPQVPQIIPDTFFNSSKMMQSILGSYDAMLGIQGNDISGKAMRYGAIQASKGSMPGSTGFINGLNQAAKICVDLIPKYYKTPRSIPTLSKEGKRGFQVINQKESQESVSMNYSPYMFEICVEPGVNSDVEKQMGMESLLAAMKVSPDIAEMIGTTEQGIGFFLDNLQMNNIDSFKEAVQEFMQQKQQQKQQNPQPSPAQMEQMKIQQQAQLEQMKLQQKQQEMQAETTLDAGKLELENRKLDIEFMELLSKIKGNEIESQVKMQQAESEDIRSAALLAMDLEKHQSELKHTTLDKVADALMHNDKMKLEHKKVDLQNEQIGKKGENERT